MQDPLYKKEETPNYANPAIRQAFVEETSSNKELIQKELNVNLEEQRLLEKRIRMMKQFINDLPASDPQYSMLLTQVKMDLIELDELKIRQALLSERINSII